ncbi:AlpA family transcriptional regulator [Brevundimonas sp. SORGH_AS_0993]|uniref:helix-turn-helix transcriptional regulator n=1 Tax=Brevundimonas sp. SORGH_AS_0993 TaxID=3041794 RepID=UPI0027D866D6|nr:AlpA family phage regulatory protein [Brevundimonas sp. SORGH_AS_0993]
MRGKITGRIIRLKTVLVRTGLSRATIYRKIKQRTFPAQVKITVRGAGWHEPEINRWVADPVGWKPTAQTPSNWSGSPLLDPRELTRWRRRLADRLAAAQTVAGKRELCVGRRMDPEGPVK